MRLKPDKNAIADYIHASKYAKYIPELHRRETFEETVNRVRRMHVKKFPELKNEIIDAFKLVHKKMILPSMRSMQFAGKSIEEMNARMYNCSFTLIDRSDVFGKILYLLLCGVGVGFSVQKHHVEKLPRLFGIDTDLVCHHTIKDTIEGWADAVNALINSFINGYYIEFNYNEIRPTGSQLSSGGKAPGHLDLKEALEATRTILMQADGRQLKPIECHDIICHLSKAVLAGGIRRSSLISLFSYDDNEMMNCKTGNQFAFGKINSQRELCNNTVVLDPNECTYQQFKELIQLNKDNFGDPGFIFLDNKDYGINPCGEIGINPVLTGLCKRDWHYPEGEHIHYGEKTTGFGFCNLVEINAAACKSTDDFYNACNYASFIATLQASYTNFPYLGKVTEKIVKRDALIGVSITGMMDANFDIFNGNVLQEGARIVERINKKIANEIGINSAARCTCIKPAGTSSLELGGVSCGIHPHPAKYYYKRITANPLEPIAQYFKKHNPFMVEEKPNGDWCITFPVQTNGAVQTDFTATEFLNKIFLVYENWILPANSKEPTHNISCTVAIKKDEWKIACNYIWENRHKIRCLTFLPLIGCAEIPYMPNEPTRPGSKWEQLIYQYKPVDYKFMEEHEDVTIRGAACDSAKCGIEDRTFIQGKGYRVFEGKVDLFIFKENGLCWQFISQYNGYFIAQRIV